MKKRILDYIGYLDELLKKEDSDWSFVMDDLLRNISFFQHERLVHLIVTCTVAILMMMSLILLYISPSFGIFVLFIILLVLLCFYLGHYYLLENKTQKLYEYYDLIRKRTNNGRK